MSSQVVRLWMPHELVDQVDGEVDHFKREGSEVTTRSSAIREMLRDSLRRRKARRARARKQEVCDE